MFMPDKFVLSSTSVFSREQIRTAGMVRSAKVRSYWIRSDRRCNREMLTEEE